MNLKKPIRSSFSLVEVVLALGVVSGSVLATVALLSIGNDTNKKARDETFAAQVALNEFSRIRSLSATNFPNSYTARYFGNSLADLGSDKTTAVKNGAVYELQIAFVAAPSGTAEKILNAQVRYPINAPISRQTVARFTTLMNAPVP